jgi:hypothetical protein
MHLTKSFLYSISINVYTYSADLGVDDGTMRRRHSKETGPL